jgi:hypothetical protein
MNTKTFFRKSIAVIAIFLLIARTLTATELYDLLKKIPEFKEIKEIKASAGFKEAYEIMVWQPIDHNKPEGEHFLQRIYLSHRDYNAPTVFETEGYAAGANYIHELSKILRANQVRVEHRFYGASIPDSMQNKWIYLTIFQAANDHHEIIKAFKKIYKGKWVSTGISKGGQTAIYYRRFFPDDVDVTVGYVCPIAFSPEDPRAYTFFDSVGTKECREKVLTFQKMALQKEKQLFPLFRDEVMKKGYKYRVTLEAAYEYSVLEYAFSFWQWNCKCDEIPVKGASIEEIFSHLSQISGFDYFSESDLSTFFYQALTEIGYYNYDITPFKGLIKNIDKPTYSFMAPANVKITYDPKPLQEVNEFLQSKGNNMLYIYGGLDPWSSCAVNVSSKTNAVKIVKENGNHTTRIMNLPDGQKELAYKTLEKWLDLKIER